MERFYILALAVLLVISCSLTNPEALSAAVAKTPPESPTAAQVGQNVPTPRPTPSRCAVTTGTAQGRLNMRACGATNCDVIEVLEEGEMLTILAAGDWLQVQTDAGAIGWANSNYCKIGEIRK